MFKQINKIINKQKIKHINMWSNKLSLSALKNHREICEFAFKLYPIVYERKSKYSSWTKNNIYSNE